MRVRAVILLIRKCARVHRCTYAHTLGLIASDVNCQTHDILYNPSFAQTSQETIILLKAERRIGKECAVNRAPISQMRQHSINSTYERDYT